MMQTLLPKPDTDSQTILDNFNGTTTVGDFLRTHVLPGSALSFVSAYFTLNAFWHLRGSLGDIHSLRFLFGEPTFLRSIDPSKALGRDYRITEEGKTLSTSRQLTQRKEARACADWIAEKVDVRSMVKPRFLHGKLYHIHKPNGTKEAVMGSSNFTVGGLGLLGLKKGNMELNVVVQDKRDAADLESWFNTLWESTELVRDVKGEVLEYLRTFYEEASPEFVYFKTLYHLFERFVREQDSSRLLADQVGFYESEVWKKLYPFQKDGVRSAINKLKDFGGCIIADSVGLGKTFEALAVIKYYEGLGKNVLVLCPKSLSENWTIYQAKKQSNLNPLERDRFEYSVLYHTDVSRERGISGADAFNFETFKWHAFDLVVIDESHNFRGTAMLKDDRAREGGDQKMNRAMALMERIIKAGTRTKVLLLSATPVNNTLRDLRNQLLLITHGDEHITGETVRISGISEILRAAQSKFTAWADPKRPERRVKDLIASLGSDFTRLLDTMTIARSRKHIQKYYSTDDVGQFPERLPPIPEYPQIDLKGRFPSYDAIAERIRTYQFRVYNPFNYLLTDELRAHYNALASRRSEYNYFDQGNRERVLVSMMRVNYLKRLESSIESFEISLSRTIDRIEALKKKIRAFKTRKKADDAGEEFETILLDADETPEGRSEDDPDGEVGSRLKYRLGHLDLDRWVSDLDADKATLSELYLIARGVHPEDDAKLDLLKKSIRKKCGEPLNAGNKKVIVFTAFADTATYLYDALRGWAKDELGLHTALIAGSRADNTFDRKNNTFNAILTHFSPRSKGRDKLHTLPQTGEIDLLIATDCISEGQNLQDCDYLVNYDIHWNPVRIIQRFGRIDRLKSPNERIQLVNFWPTPDLNRYINLKERVESRMALVDLTATAEDDLLQNTDALEDLIGADLKYRDQQLLRMKDEVLDLEDLTETPALTDFTLDDFRAELQHYFTDETKRRLAEAPTGLYAVVPAPAGPHAHLAQPGLFGGAAMEIVKPGTIYCLRRNEEEDSIAEEKERSSAWERINPLAPHYLVYVYDDGTVRFTYTSARTILDIFRLLCQGVKDAYPELCRLFNNETKDGEDMSTQSALLQKALAAIRQTDKKRNAAQLTTGGRGAQLVAGAGSDTAEADHTFTLITWLVLK